MFSGTITYCVVNGKDAYDRGAKYNNLSVCWVGLTSAVDIMTAVKTAVFGDGIITLDKLNVENVCYCGRKICKRNAVKEICASTALDKNGIAA